MSIEITVRRFYTAGADNEGQLLPSATFLIANEGVADFKLQPVVDSLEALAKSVPAEFLGTLREMTDEEAQQVIRDEHNESPAFEEDEDEIFED